MKVLGLERALGFGDKGLQLRATARTGSVPQVKSGAEVKFYSTSYNFTLEKIVDEGLKHVSLGLSKNGITVYCKRPQPLCKASTMSRRLYLNLSWHA